ncbi:MAG: hypothetical protein F4X19_05420 [Acidobacteria bacterium]|nr:hypothetical protein [Acidobacteriota bacterium]
MQIPWRKNVLVLMGAGYAAVVVIFGAMVWPGKMTPEQAYEVVKGPLMALIGGSLAISKDLIPFGISTGADDRGDGHTHKDEHKRQDKPTTE